MASSPVVLLASANSGSEYLPQLDTERAAIDKALREFNDNRFIQVVQSAHTSLDDLFETCNHYATRLAILHYSGHASGAQLLLERDGQAQLANATGLAQLLGRQPSLQLVFLNGCATQQQVETLFAQGVKAVIATSCPIDDRIARDFATQFYTALATNLRPTIHEAFLRAQAFVAANAQAARAVGEFRGMSYKGKADSASAAMPWGLYVREGGDDVLHWRLPEVAEHAVTFVAGPPSAPRPRPQAEAAFAAPPVVNTSALADTPLVQALFGAVTAHRPDVAAMWEVMKKFSQVDPRMVAPTILDSYPTPVAEQIRKLFADTAPSSARLRQIVVTYETLIQLLCFSALAQLWDATHDDAKLIPTAEQIAAVETFVAIGAAERPTYDYLALTAVVAEIFKAHGLQPFVQELSELPAVLPSSRFQEAYRFLEQLRGTAGSLEAAAAADACVPAEAHLTTVMTRLAFIVCYQLAVTKSINVSKSRHREPEFVHMRVMLDKLTRGIGDVTMTLATVTDTAAVILSNDRGSYLSLTPFVVDEHALTGHESSKLFFFSHRQDGRYHYRFIGDADDALVVDDKTYEVITKQFETFMDEVRP
jgi:hypothetical protein